MSQLVSLEQVHRHRHRQSSWDPDVAAGGADAGALVPIGEALVAMDNWTFLLGPGFVVGIATVLILGYLMFRSGLMPRGMSMLGLIGGPLATASGISVLLGVIAQGSAAPGTATIPEILWEASLGLYLTFKGFRPSPMLAAISEPPEWVPPSHAVDEAPRAPSDAVS